MKSAISMLSADFFAGLSRQILNRTPLFLAVPFFVHCWFIQSFVSVSAAQAAPVAGSMPSTTYKLISVKVTGSKRFTQQEIALASGLPVGTVAHEPDFQKAARQLGESGAFSNISFTYSYSATGTKLEFQVVDAEKFVPAKFSDFVWFTDDQLRAQIHERVPLFNGDLPTTGRLADQVSDVLQAMLVENAVPGQVEYTPTKDKKGDVQSIDYNVAGVSIRIHKAEFPGAGASELPLLNQAAERLTDREYSRAYMSSFIDHGILPIFRERGFLQAACAAAEPKVVKVSGAEPGATGQLPTFVDVTFPVTPGTQYKLSGWQWSGNKAISTQELQPLIHAKIGQVADTIQLNDDLRAVQLLYGSRGYIIAAFNVQTEFDNAAGTVAYLLEVNEGPLFRMGELEFRGLDNNLTARLRAAWKLRPGDVYDASYLQEFLPLARRLLPANLDWQVASHVTAMTRDKTVDVSLEYTAKAPK
ncbi:MAG TPA: POTRA domain-containing protein, partial [Verrucomicrobiae bacterium]|nr:POTRA domain-containing protein [Verrucomicrobiae bacterium]